MDESESEKKKKPRAPLKRIKTIVIKKKASMRREVDGPPSDSLLSPAQKTKKLKKLQSHHALGRDRTEK